MDIVYEQKIRLRAYELWIDDGMGEGNAEHHWLRAEKVVRNETEVPTSADAIEARRVDAEPKPAKAAKARPEAKMKAEPTAKADMKAKAAKEAATKTKAATNTKPAKSAAKSKPAAAKVVKVKAIKAASNQSDANV